MAIDKPNKVLNTLRWIGFLPAAVLAAWLTWILMVMFWRFSIISLGIEAIDYLEKFYFMVGGHMAMGAIFAYVGMLIAPTHRRNVSYIVGGVGVVITVYTLIPDAYFQDWWAVTGSLLFGASVIAVVWAIDVAERST